MKRLFCLDGHNLVYRACYSPAPMLRSVRGEPTKGPYLFLRILQRLVRDWPVDYLVVTLDSPRETLRKRLVDNNYKRRGQAGGPPDDIKVQFRLCVDMLKQLGIPSFAVRGWEADDLMASLVRKFQTHSDIETYVVTSDKDLHQLVRDDVFCLDIFSGALWNRREVQAKWGVPPEQVVEVQALAGDATDGVPGVRGIGPVRAAELVRLFGGAQEVHANVGKILSGNYGSRRGAKALAATSLAEIERTRKLVALDRRVPLPYQRIEELAFTGLHTERARPFFNYLGFKQWSIDSSTPAPTRTRSLPGFIT